jgi:hypothetical protein
MKKPIKLLTTLLFVSLFTVSCEKNNEQIETTPVTTNQTVTPAIGDWETNDPKVINSINDQIERKLRSSKATSLIYRNFKLMVDNSTPDDIIALIKKEIDQLYTSEFKSTTISKMDNVRGIYLAKTGEDVGLYYSNSLVVINDYSTFRRVKRSTSNVVGHELAHYYHDNHLPNGENNANVRSLHRNAVSKRIYPARDYVLSNRFEYLATSAEAYYFGTSRNPFDKSNVTKKDPNLKTFFTTNF